MPRSMLPPPLVSDAILSAETSECILANRTEVMIAHFDWMVEVTHCYSWMALENQEALQK